MTNRRRRGSGYPQDAPKGPLKKPRPVWFVTLMAFVLPGSGQVFNGAPTRGVIFQFGMVMGGFISYQLTTPEISFFGRMAGGLLVYVFSIVDANGIAKLRVKAWERIEAGQPPRPRKGMTRAAAVQSRLGGAKGGSAPARRAKGPAGRASGEAAKSGRARTAAGDPAGRGEGSAAAAPPENATSPDPAPSERRSG